MTSSAQISAVADLLLHRRRREMQQSETEARQNLADHLGINARTLRRRLKGELRWEADEVAAMAEFFDMPLMAFYNGPAALFVGAAEPTRTGSIRQYLADSADFAAAA